MSRANRKTPSGEGIEAPASALLKCSFRGEQAQTGTLLALHRNHAETPGLPPKQGVWGSKLPPETLPGSGGVDRFFLAGVSGGGGGYRGRLPVFGSEHSEQSEQLPETQTGGGFRGKYSVPSVSLLTRNTRNTYSVRSPLCLPNAARKGAPRPDAPGSYYPRPLLTRSRWQADTPAVT